MLSSLNAKYENIFLLYKNCVNRILFTNNNEIKFLKTSHWKEDNYLLRFFISSSRTERKKL